MPHREKPVGRSELIWGRDDREAFERRLDRMVALDGSSDDGDVLRSLRSGADMRFYLTYDGSLKSAGQNNPRTKEKWDIRRRLEPQLAELWNVHHGLQGKQMFYPRPSSAPATDRPSDEVREILRKPVMVGGHPFIPLVRDARDLTCSLDILFLRKSRPGSVISDSGDLDNRLKVLFDGLRIPTDNEMKEAGELPDGPFHCLLEDDGQITSLAVRTGWLLSRPDASVNEVRLVMDVAVNPTRLRVENSGFWGD